MPPMHIVGLLIEPSFCHGDFYSHPPSSSIDVTVSMGNQCSVRRQTSSISCLQNDHIQSQSIPENKQIMRIFEMSVPKQPGLPDLDCWLVPQLSSGDNGNISGPCELWSLFCSGAICKHIPAPNFWYKVWRPADTGPLAGTGAQRRATIWSCRDNINHAQPSKPTPFTPGPECWI